MLRSYNILYYYRYTGAESSSLQYLSFSKRRPLTVTQRYQERFGRAGSGGRRRFVGDPSAVFARDSSAAADGASVFARVTAHDGDRGRPRSASPAVALPPPPLPRRRRRRTGPHPKWYMPRRPRVVRSLRYRKTRERRDAVQTTLFQSVRLRPR